MATRLTKYNMSNADLAMLSSNFVTFMNRDATEFATRGVTAQDITDFQALGNAFETFPTDDVFRADVTIEVNAKDAARDAALLNIQVVSSFFEQEWGLGSPQYSKLRIKGIHSVSESNFLLSARAVTTQATEQLSILTPIGLTQTMIDNLTANAQTMEDKLNGIADAEATREIKTIERIEKGNELYSFVQKYSKIGKAIWENVNQAKLDNYIINPTVHSTLGKVQNLAGVFIPASGGEVNRIDLSWNAVAGADGYDVFVSITPIGVPPTQFALLAGSPTTTFSHSPLPIVPSDYNYKVHAATPTSVGADSDVELVQAV